MSSSKRPPAPPSRPSTSSNMSAAPPSYDSIAYPDPPTSMPWATGDPRSSSQQSLVPSESGSQDQRRKLLLVYIHGFMGNETSFRSFPAHVHNLLTVLLAETHVVHTKLYPRYRSKRNISFARDDFSTWLEPHEGTETDVVLLGHSMGGLLSAEVVLMPHHRPGPNPLRHRILGTINFDVPFLGMHPGVVKSGLASIFTSAEEPGDRWGDSIPGDTSENGKPASSGRMDTLWNKPDPHYNQNFANDVVLPMREGWKNAFHFVNKHKDHLFKETKRLVTSHLEFGGAMANYGELKARYTRVRALEAESADVRKSVVNNNKTPARVRFVNYYTASTGRPKKSKTSSRSPSPGINGSRTNLAPSDAVEGLQNQDSGILQSTRARSPSPRISLEEHSDRGVVKKEPEVPSSEDEDWNRAAETMTIMDPAPYEGDDEVVISPMQDDDDVLSPIDSLATTTSFGPVPDVPSAPSPLDTSYIEDQATRKLVEKEHARAVKAYEKAVKEHEKAIRARQKLEDKQKRESTKDSEKAIKDAEKAAKNADKLARSAEKTKMSPQMFEKELTHSQREELRMEKERQRMEAEGRRMRGEPEPDSEPTTVPAPEIRRRSEQSSNPPISVPSSPEPSIRGTVSRTTTANSKSGISRTTTANSKSADPPKDRKFCTLPPKDSNGERDPTWVRVFMQDVDEVGAHCGLFFVDERYERLVGDVASRIEGWVKEDADGRWVKAISGDGSGEKGGWDLD